MARVRMAKRVEISPRLRFMLAKLTLLFRILWNRGLKSISGDLKSWKILWVLLIDFFLGNCCHSRSSKEMFLLLVFNLLANNLVRNILFNLSDIHITNQWLFFHFMNRLICPFLLSLQITVSRALSIFSWHPFQYSCTDWEIQIRDLYI